MEPTELLELMHLRSQRSNGEQSRVRLRLLEEKFENLGVAKKKMLCFWLMNELNRELSKSGKTRDSSPEN